MMLLSLFYFKFHHQPWKHRQSPSAFRTHCCQRLSATAQRHRQNTCPSNPIPFNDARPTSERQPGTCAHLCQSRQRGERRLQVFAVTLSSVGLATCFLFLSEAIFSYFLVFQHLSFQLKYCILFLCFECKFQRH